MKKHIIIFSFLLLATLTLLAGEIAPVQAENNTLTGGNYVLTAASPQSPTGMSGGEYQLAPAALSGEDGCCCKANMPCIIR